jgi:hypothetical protein
MVHHREMLLKISLQREALAVIAIVFLDIVNGRNLVMVINKMDLLEEFKRNLMKMKSIRMINLEIKSKIEMI